jgi:VCBS repeat-containing protein
MAVSRPGEGPGVIAGGVERVGVIAGLGAVRPAGGRIMSIAYFKLALGNFLQDWSNSGAIGADDNWDNVPSIVGYLGNGVTSGTGKDPRTLTAPTASTPDVNANRSDPSVFSTGGVAEFDGIPDRTVAIQGSGSANAPSLVIFLDATGRENITFSTRLRDIDTGTTAIQPIAIQYRIGETGNWINVAGGYVANANNGGDTLVSVVLPSDVNGQAMVQVRVITADAVGSDAFIGIDDITVTSQPLQAVNHGALAINDASVVEGDAGTAAISFTVHRDGGSAGAVSATYSVNFTGSANAADFAPGTAFTGTVAFADGETVKTITLQVAGDTVFEPNDGFTVTLSAPTGGAGLGDAEAAGTILNDDPVPTPGTAFINEVHYDNSGVDAGEAVEIAGPAGTSLAGWTLVLYNGGNGASYGTIALSGTIAGQDDGYGTLSFAAPGLQNGSPDGFALVNAQGQVVQFLSYEGVMTATNGPANGLVSTDIGVAEEPAPGAGISLQLTGSGASYADFHWTTGGAASFGAVNAGQDFIGANANGLVRVADVSVAEGDDGSHKLVFTVLRAGGLGGSGSVNYAINLDGTASAADIAAGTPLSGTLTFAPGETSKQIVIGVTGDTIGEANETLSLALSNPTGALTIEDGLATGTIVNDDPIALAIYEIQGEGHSSAYAGQTVITHGIVTATDTNGFYLQDALGDGNSRTSDAVFVFTGTAAAVAVGDALTLTGVVQEFSGAEGSLSVTEIANASFTIVSSGNALPAAVLIGVGGVLPPSQVIDDDHMTSYDPATDGIDFYESLEGMRVTIDTPLVVSNTNGFGETYVVASGGAGATGVSARGGITISAGDFNPEKIQLQADSGLYAGYAPAHTEGDRLGSVTGIMNYSHDVYELLVTQAVTVTSDVTLQAETTSLEADRNHLAVATYNLENIDPSDPQMKFDLLAGNIVYNLSAPDIIAVQEIQDGNGAEGSDPLSGTVTAQHLIAAIDALGGPHYVYIEIAPTTANSTGGEPGGNIRSGYLYNPDRVSYVTGSAELVPGSAFNGTRSPLAATFTFNNQNVTLINVHFTSRGGSDPLFGSVQPPADAGDAARTAQAQAVRAYVNDHLADNPALNIGVLGDFNGFYFENGIASLEAGGVLTDLQRTLPVEERYSYLFDGNLQAIDHIIVTGGLLGGAKYDAVHINAEVPEGTPRGTDHDPQIATFFLRHPNEAPEGLAIDHQAVDENAPAGILVGTLSATDPDGDVLHYTLVNDAGGRFALDPATGKLTTTGPLDYEAGAAYDVTVRATDPSGLSTDKVISIAVGDVNEAPTGLAISNAAVDENAAAGTLVGTVSAGDPDGDALTYSLVDNAGGRFAIDAASGAVTTTAPFDYEAGTGYSITARSTDADGLTTERVLAISVRDVNEAPTARGDAVAVNEDATTANLWSGLLANDSDPDAGTQLTIASVDTSGTQGHVLFDAATQSLRYVADADAYDALAPGDTAVDHFSYTVTDGHGLTSTATVDVTITGIADGVTVAGGNGNDIVQGTSGEDTLSGGNGNDTLYGLDGHDVLVGGNGNDLLFGGTGNDRLYGDNGDDRLDGGAGNDRISGGNGSDVLIGGAGNDIFVFGRGGGSDTVLDFQTASDRLFLEDGIQVKSVKVEDVNHDGIADLNITFSNGGGSVALLGVGDFSAVHFAYAGGQTVAETQFYP